MLASVLFLVLSIMTFLINFHDLKKRL